MHYPIRGGIFRRPVGAVKAVDGVSFAINSGETFALVGESGCGKSTTGYATLGIVRATAGQVELSGDGPDASSTVRHCATRNATCRSSSRTRTPRSIRR